MTKKKRDAKPQREFTRRQLSQFKRQKRRQRIILISGIFVIAAVVLTVLVGWYIGEYRPLHQTAIRVYDTEFDMGYYIDTLRIVSAGQQVEDMQSLADNIVGEIEQNELIKQEAWEQFEIRVSDDEVKKVLEGADMAVNDASMDLIRSQMLRDRLYNEHFASQVPESDRQVNMMAMLLESESQVAEIKTRLQNSDNFTALAEELSLETYTKSNKGDLGWHTESIITALLGTSVPVEYAFNAEIGELSQPIYDEGISKGVGYWLIKVPERQYEEEAQVQAILLGSEKEAQEVRARLEAGEDFATLAEELSQFEESKEHGGSLGLVEQGEMSAAFDEYVFDPELEIGALSEPIRDETVETEGGYWLIKVLDRDDDRKLGDDDRSYLITTAFDEWVASLWANLGQGNVDISYLTPERQEWAIERAQKS